MAEDAAIYWSKENGSLANIIEAAEQLNDCDIRRLGNCAKERIHKAYSWEYIVDKYEDVWNKNWS